jgi:hypothetical protein
VCNARNLGHLARSGKIAGLLAMPIPQIDDAARDARMGEWISLAKSRRFGRRKPRRKPVTP